MIENKQQLIRTGLEIYRAYFEGELQENEFVKALFSKSDKARIQSLFEPNRKPIGLLFSSMFYMKDYPEEFKRSFMENTNNLHIALLLIELAYVLRFIKDYNGAMVLPDGDTFNNLLHLINVTEFQIL